MSDPIAPFLGIVILVAVLPVAIAHMLGGGGWSGKVMQLYGRILRALFAFPFLLIGRLFTEVGGSIKGGSGKKKRKS